jgi:hypothetical protein
MENGISTMQCVRDNPVILKHFISVSLLSISYPVRDETGKERGDFLAMIFPIKREADLMLLSFTGDHHFQGRLMKHNHLITKRLTKVFQFYLRDQMKHGTGKGACFTASRVTSREAERR